VASRSAHNTLAMLRAREARLDLVGIWLFAAALTWPLLSASVAGGDPLAAIRYLGVGSGAVLVGRLLGSISRAIFPASLVVVSFALIVLFPGQIFSGDPVGGPWETSSATGAFYVQGAVAGLMLAVRPRQLPLRILGVTAAIVFGVVPFVARARAAAILLLVLGIPAILARSTSARRFLVTAYGAIFAAVLVATVLLGATFTGEDRVGVVDQTVDATLTIRRPVLWQDALFMMTSNPITGVGPGLFHTYSGEVNKYRERYPWERGQGHAHNVFLQLGAETGIPGFLLLTALFAWGFVRIRVLAAPDAMAVMGAVALAAVGIQSCISNVLASRAVSAATWGLVGAVQLERVRRR